jgi:hypothetical protein
MANPVAQKLKKFSELVRILLEFPPPLPPPGILNSFSATLLRSLKNSSDSKSMSTCYENFNVDFLSKIVYYVISSTYIHK